MVKQINKDKDAAKKTNKKVDFEPNKMAFAVASLAAVSLVLLAVITMYR